MTHIMYGKTKNNQVPSDTQARERLAIYVYEYLTHVGASKTANLFLQEIGWEKEIGISDPPGFLHSWWCVFWDLYCASPERRDTSEHSTEAKAFHDYSSSNVPSMTSMPGDGMNPQGVHPGYFPPGSAASPSPHHNPNNLLIRQPFMSPRYPPGAPRPGMQAPGPQSMLQGMDHPRQGQMMSRMPHPRGMPPSSMNPYGPDQFQHSYGRMNTLPNHSGMPMGPMPGRYPWPASSGPPGQTPGVPPTTPMMRSPPGPRPHMQPGPHPHRFPQSHDPKNPDAMNPDYGHMNKAMQHQQMPSSFAMGGSVPESMPSTTISMSGGPGLPASTPNMTPGLNGLNGSGHDPGMIEGLPKSSPSNSLPMNAIGGPGAPPMGPPGGGGGTPRTPQDGEGDSFNMGTFNDNHQDQNESAEILKIKESMRQEAKRFETNETDGNPTNEFGFMS